MKPPRQSLTRSRHLIGGPVSGRTTIRSGIPGLVDRMAGAPSIAEAIDRLSAGRSVTIEGLHGAAKAISIAAIRRGAGGHFVLYVCELETDADAVRHDLQAVDPEARVGRLPGWNPRAGTWCSPPIDVLSQRVECLHALASARCDVVVATTSGISIRVPPPTLFREQAITLRRGDEGDPGTLFGRLIDLGFEPVDIVQEVGEVARRGGIIDVFTFGRRRPVRIEFWGDEVASIREFRVGDQRSSEELSDLTILPRREIIADPETISCCARAMKASGRIAEAQRLVRDPYAEGYESLLAGSGYRLTDLTAYLPGRGVLVIDTGRGEKEPVDGGPLVLHPTVLFDALGDWPSVICRDLFVGSSPDLFRCSTEVLPGAARDAQTLRRAMEREAKRGTHIVVVSERPSEIRGIADAASAPIELIPGRLSGGFACTEIRLAVLTDHEIHGKRYTRIDPPRFDEGTYIADAFSLEPGDLVVHIEHGVGRFEGLKRLTVDGKLTDCLSIEYDGGDRILLPIDRLDRVHRLEDGDEPSTTGRRLDRIGGRRWAGLLEKTRNAIQAMADELLRTQAIRRHATGHQYRGDPHWQKELEDSFPFDVTPDQEKAFKDVERDLASPHPMDRLVCGDVGFGKTEVAVRSAFRVASEGKQVAILVPTTLLAEQHYETFRRRFAPYPIEVRSLSRFRSGRAQKEIVEGLRSGRVDVVIGTHRLLSSDIEFADLGLLIVDEEHRFGVRQKEKLKSLKATVEVLSLTATPIPRTLDMALSGIRDLSVIATPPANRFPIDTEILPFSPSVVREAITAELKREGQVFFVHNRIRSIDPLAEFVARVVPQARVAVAHGQMPAKKLERVMRSFYHREIDVLVCTMIVESGLDFPNANTILVNRADHLGLAQLHQLRGRVGRGPRRARAILLVSAGGPSTREARQRLRAVRDHTGLGSGYSLAMRDLEIRGAGNLLGAEQHGFMKSVGYETYFRLLEEVVREARGQPTPVPIEVKISARSEAYIPDSYVRSNAERFTLYKRLSRLDDLKRIQDLREEMIDRFGPLPEPARNLTLLKELEVRLRAMGIDELSIDEDGFRLGWHPEHSPDRRVIESIARAFVSRIRFVSSDRLAMVVARKPGTSSSLEGAIGIVNELEHISDPARREGGDR